MSRASEILAGMNEGYGWEGEAGKKLQKIRRDLETVCNMPRKNASPDSPEVERLFVEAETRLNEIEKILLSAASIAYKNKKVDI